MPGKPDKEISCQNCHKGEGNPDLHKIREFHRVTVLLQHPDRRDIGTGANRGDISPEGCTGKKPEIQEIGLDTKQLTDARNDRKHGRHVRNIVYESGEEHGTPNNNRVQ